MTQFHPAFSQSMAQEDSIVISIFVDILVQLTNTVFVNTTNISTTIETAVLYRRRWEFAESCDDDEIIIDWCLCRIYLNQMANHKVRAGWDGQRPGDD